MRENKYTTEDLKTMQAWSLERKIQVTQTRLIEWYQKFGGKVYVSFSGGKNSTVLLHIARQLYPDIEAVFGDTGLEDPEIREFVKSFDNVTWLRPEINFREVVTRYGYPLISKNISHMVDIAKRNPNGEVAKNFFDPSVKSIYSAAKYIPLLVSDFNLSSICCDIMKKKPAKLYTKQTGKKPIVATMACESKLRENVWLNNGCNAFDAKSPQSSPMSFWTEQDVLELSIYADIKCLTPLFMAILSKKTASLRLRVAREPAVFSADLERISRRSQQGFRCSRKRTRNYIITA